VILVGAVAHRELELRHAGPILVEAATATAAVMLIICAAGAFGFYMAWERIPPRLAAALVTLTQDPLLLLVLINLLLLVVGMFIEGTAALIILTPILVPVVTRLGIDPVHFGLVIVLNLTIGGVTPPVGTLMYITTTVLRARIEDFTREALPFLAALVAVLALVTAFPGLVLWLPRVTMG
jgi:tripartite ATP-independent transporter DctM subunit